MPFTNTKTDYVMFLFCSFVFLYTFFFFLSIATFICAFMVVFYMVKMTILEGKPTWGEIVRSTDWKIVKLRLSLFLWEKIDEYHVWRRKR